MGRSIDEWFADAEGRRLNDSAYDWENDDALDQTPDSWLDRIKHRNVPEASSSHAPRLLRLSRAAWPGLRYTSSGYLRSELAEAVRTIREKSPGIGAKGVLRRLREAGWLSIAAADLDEIAREDGNESLTVPRRKARSETRSSRSAGPRAGNKVGPPRTRVTPYDLICAIEKEHPGLDVHELARRVRESGLSYVTWKDVRAVLAQRQSTPICPDLAPTPSPPRLHPESCRACGVVPSPLGTCRCS